MTVSQYPHVRKTTWCPLCGHSKSVGLVLCWPCHNGCKELGDGDYPVQTQVRLAKLDKDLKDHKVPRGYK